MVNNNAGSENHSSLSVPTLPPLPQPSANPATAADVKLSLDPLEVHTLPRHFNLVRELIDHPTVAAASCGCQGLGLFPLLG